MMNVKLPSGKTVSVETLRQAAEEIESYVQRAGIGSSQFYGCVKGVGFVRNEKGEHVATVSYNGRVWPPGKWTPGMKALEV